MNFKLTFYLAVSLLIATPSVFGQKKRYDCSQVISIGGGAHQVATNNFKGYNYNISIENTTRQHFTLLYNLRNLTEKSNLNYLLPKTVLNETIFEHRVNMQTGINWYPLSALHGFYAGIGAGVFLHINRENPPVSFNTSSFILKATSTGMGFSNDVKIGYQQIFKSGFVCNLHMSAGLFHPKFEGLKFGAADGVVLIGLNIGKSFG
jgi:hypothetical protein